MSAERTIATWCAAEPELGPHLTTKPTSKPRVLIGWNHQNDTEEGMRERRIWVWVSEGAEKQPKLQCYMDNVNRSPYPGVWRDCGPVNFTMIRMFHPYWCPGGRIPEDKVINDKRQCRELYIDFMRKVAQEQATRSANTGFFLPVQPATITFSNRPTSGLSRDGGERSEGSSATSSGPYRSQPEFSASPSPRQSLDSFDLELGRALDEYHSGMAGQHYRRRDRHGRARLHRHMSNPAAIHSNRRKERAPREQVTGVEECIKEESQSDIMSLDSDIEEEQGPENSVNEEQVQQNGFNEEQVAQNTSSSAEQARQSRLAFRSAFFRNALPAQMDRARSLPHGGENDPTRQQVNDAASRLIARWQSEGPTTARANEDAQQRACSKEFEVKKEGESNENESGVEARNQEKPLPVWGTGAVVVD